MDKLSKDEIQIRMQFVQFVSTMLLSAFTLSFVVLQLDFPSWLKGLYWLVILGIVVYFTKYLSDLIKQRK